MKAVILAAGRGERLWPLTETRPKHLLPIGGRPILEGTVSSLAEAGVSNIILVVSYKSEMIKSCIGDGGRFNCKVDYVIQRRPGGTADALKTCLGELEGEDRFLVAYGDDYYDAEAIARFVRSEENESGVAMGVAEVRDASRFGRVDLKDGLVVSIQEKVAGKGRATVNAGLYFLDESVLLAIRKTKLSVRGELELTDSLKILVRRGRQVRAFAFREGDWQGVTYPWDLLEANRLALERLPARSGGALEQGVRVNGPLSTGTGCVVKSGCYLEGPIFLDEGCTVGPNAYLRPYTSIGKNGKVGAGCEVKNSIFMDEVKVPHLSYVGDSILGQGSSLGAGTITANLRFDDGGVASAVRGRKLGTGMRKLGTILGDGVKTGVNVSFFPGVKVGPYSWVGPGGLVKKDVPSRARMKGYSR